MALQRELQVLDPWGEFLSSPIETNFENYANTLKEWVAKTFAEVKHMFRVIEKKLAKAQRLSPDANMIAACNTMAAELDELHRVEEAYWHMR